MKKCRYYHNYNAFGYARCVLFPYVRQTGVYNNIYMPSDIMSMNVWSMTNLHEVTKNSTQDIK